MCADHFGTELYKYNVSWQHGPAPGLTYYDGMVLIEAEDEESAGIKAKRIVTERWCFSPGCVTITKVKPI